MGNISDSIGGTFVVRDNLEFYIQADDEFDAASADDQFDEDYNEGAVKEAMALAPSYEEKETRANPWERGSLKRSLGVYSLILGRPLETFGDTVQHALELCRMWEIEDKENQRYFEDKKKDRLNEVVDKKTRHMVPGTHEYELEEARVAWKNAVRLRNETMATLNNSVEKARARFQMLKKK